MSKPKHTPGPWTLRLETEDGYPERAEILMASALPDDEGDYPWRHKPAHIIDVQGYLDGGYQSGSGEALANAYLIAAAPEMYEALVALTEECGAVPHSDCEERACVLARAALAKARGES